PRVRAARARRRGRELLAGERIGSRLWWRGASSWTSVASRRAFGVAALLARAMPRATAIGRSRANSRNANGERANRPAALRRRGLRKCFLFRGQTTIVSSRARSHEGEV